MTPVEYLKELKGQVRWDELEEFDKYIQTLEAFNEIGLLTPKEFYDAYDFLYTHLPNFGYTYEGISDLFSNLPVLPVAKSELTKTTK